MIKVKGHSNLYRDENTGSIINCDTANYNQYVNSIAQKDLRKKELDKMKNDIEEIKTLLKELIKNN
jgi:hypothetical protein